MDIEEIKRMKIYAEDEILRKINNLENDLGITITDLGIGGRVQVIGGKSYIEEVNITMEV